MKRHISGQLIVCLGLSVIAAGCAKSGELSELKSSGSERLSWTNEPVVFESANSGLPSDSVTASAVNVSLQLSQAAVLAPPTVGGQLLQANAIDVVLNKAYVAYNTQGPGYGGGVDVIDITNQAAPTMTSSATFANVDFAGISRDGTDLYAAASDAGGAKLYHWTLGLLGLVGDISGTPEVVPLIGAVGTGVKAFAGNVYVASGDNGGLTIIPRTDLLSLITSIPVSLSVAIPDARGVSVSLLGGTRVVTGTRGTGLSALPAGLQKFDNAGASQGTEVSLGVSVDDESKSSVISGTIFDLATAGEGGTKLICKQSGSVTTLPNPSIAGLGTSLTAANSATFGNGLIYVANGAAGIYVYSVEQTNAVLTPCAATITYQGRILLEDGASVNNVYYSPGRLIVATGAGGFRILTVVQANVLGLLSTL